MAASVDRVAGLRHLDAARLQPGVALVRAEPFPIVVASGLLDASRTEQYARDFPNYSGAGFFPYADADCGPSMRELVAELSGPEFAQRIGAALGVSDLGSRPTLITLSRSLQPRHGAIHTDSDSKIVTALLYLNASWPATSGGCLRCLANAHDFEAIVVPEVRPLYGNLAAFGRRDNSFHGHLPHEGERRVIQVAWLVSEAAKQRKTKRGRLSRFVKWLLRRRA